jgi:tRNA1Val (adenine37-N6)-methyltransferase
MPNSYFKFKQFTIKQEKSAMKVGTDGVLLGAWATAEGVSSALDIGTGTGLIALMIAQRSKARIKAIEIDKTATTESQENIVNSPWCERIHSEQISLQKFIHNNTQQFDLIVCNPPYFINSLQSKNTLRNIARHNQTLDYEDLISGVEKLLARNGCFSVIIPVEHNDFFYEKAKVHDLFLIRRTIVKPAPEKSPHRVLLEFSKIKMPLTESSLTIESGKRHEYTSEYKNLTKTFYLAF